MKAKPCAITAIYKHNVGIKTKRYFSECESTIVLNECTDNETRRPIIRSSAFYRSIFLVEESIKWNIGW